MVTSGVRSSCEASAAKRRIRASDAILAAKAVSMCASMALSELPKPAHLGARVLHLHTPGQVSRGDRGGRLLHPGQRPEGPRKRSRWR